MKHFYLIALLTLGLLTSCGSSKKALETGNYDKVITDAALELKKNPNNERQALYLQEAYNKATARDLSEIERLKASSSPTKWIEIYDIYDRMLIREIAIAPVVPIYADGKELQLNVPSVDAKAEEAKQKASSYLYDEASKLLYTGDKMDARKAYEYFDQLVEFNFNYKDAREKRETAKLKGSTNVYVTMINKTDNSLPTNFEDDLLSFREGSFSDPWILYSNKKTTGITYDYQVDLTINQLIVGRYQEQQRQYREQQRVIVGYTEGKDKDGNSVRVPQYQTVYADILETLQAKPIRVAGSAEYRELPSQTVLATIPIEREEAWQNTYAQFRGDERALSQETIQKIQNGKQQVPTDEQFLELSGKLLNQVVVQMFEQNGGNLK